MSTFLNVSHIAPNVGVAGSDWEEKSTLAFLTHQPIIFLEFSIISQIMISLSKKTQVRQARWATNGPDHLAFQAAFC